MTDLQAFKAALVVGAKCVFRAAWCPVPTIRTVTIVQTGKAAFTHPKRSGDSWLDFPRASEILQSTPGVFTIYPPVGPVGSELTYDFRPASIAAAETKRSESA